MWNLIIRDPKPVQYPEDKDDVLSPITSAASETDKKRHESNEPDSWETDSDVEEKKLETKIDSVHLVLSYLS